MCQLEGFLRPAYHDFAMCSPINYTGSSPIDFAASSPPQQNWVISPAAEEEPRWRAPQIQYRKIHEQNTLPYLVPTLKNPQGCLEKPSLGKSQGYPDAAPKNRPQLRKFSRKP